MSEREVIVALAEALVRVRTLDADPRSLFTAVHRALEDVERLIFHHKEQFGVHSAHFQQGCEEFLLLSNTLAMKALQRSTPEDIITSEQCGDLLLRAEHHTRHSGYLRSIPEAQHTNHRRAFRLITLNNLACHAKHTGKPIAAVGFLERALKLQVKYQGTEPSIPDHEIALNRLNLCAVLSQLNRHVAAAAHAKAAVALLSTAEEASDKLNAEGSQLLLVAHYNLAVELEHLSDHDAAWRQYELVIAVAERHQLRHDLVESVRAILSQESLKPSSKSPRARTPRELYKPQRRPLSPKTLRVTQSMRTIFEADAWGGDFISGQFGADQVIMSVGNGDGDELETPGVPLLYLGNNAPVDETLALSISIVATATVDPAVQEAVEELAQAVAGATQWFADAVRGELIPQAAITVDTPVTKPVEEENKHDSSSPIVSPLRLGEPLPIVNRPPSAIILVVAKAAVDAAIHGAVKQVIRAVEKATEWITQAVENELVSQAVDPAEGTTIHNVTEWITQAVRSELVAHAVADAIHLSDTSTISMDADTPEVPVHDAPRLSLDDEPSIAAVRELAKVTAEAAVSIALQSVAQAIGDASNWLTQAARGELLAEAVIEASPGPDDVPQVDEIDNNSTDSLGLIAPQQQPSPSTEDYLINVPALQLPNSAPVSSVVMTELAVPFVNEVVASALDQAVPVSSPEPEDEVYDDDYTPINTPTAEEAPSKSPLPSTRSPEQDTPFVPPVIISGRATPPSTKPAPRRKSPITSSRGLGTPPSKDNSLSSAPPALAVADERSTVCTEPESVPSTLPPLVLPGIPGAPLVSGRTKHHPKTPRKTPRFDEAIFVSDSSRTPSKTSSRLEKHTSRSSRAELEPTSLSSARAAAQIYAQQPPSSRHQHHHHKSKKLRDAASQTSPPPSPTLTTLPQQPRISAHDTSHGSELSELPKTQTPRLKHSSRGVSSPGNRADKKAEGGSNNTLLAPLARTPVVPPPDDASPPKASSPSRTHRNHAHGHQKGGGGGSTSPNKRSGYCQRCIFEGRSCKINDCLKHQVLK